MQTPQRRWHQSTLRTRKTGGFHPYSFSGFQHHEPLFSCSSGLKGKPLIQYCMKPQKMCRTKEKICRTKFEAKVLILLKHTKSLKSKTLHSKDKFLLLFWCHWSGNLKAHGFLELFPGFCGPYQGKDTHLSCDTLIVLLPFIDKTRKSKVMQPNPFPKDWNRVHKNVSFSISFD